MANLEFGQCWLIVQTRSASWRAATGLISPEMQGVEAPSSTRFARRVGRKLPSLFSSARIERVRLSRGVLYNTTKRPKRTLGRGRCRPALNSGTDDRETWHRTVPRIEREEHAELNRCEAASDEDHGTENHAGIPSVCLSCRHVVEPRPARGRGLEPSDGPKPRPQGATERTA